MFPYVCPLQVISALYLAGNRHGSFGKPARLPYTYSRVCVANKERAGKGNCSKVGGWEGRGGGWKGWWVWGGVGVPLGWAVGRRADGSWLLGAGC